MKLSELISGHLYRFLIRFLSRGRIYPIRREVGDFEISFGRLSQVPATGNHAGGGFAERGFAGGQHQLYTSLHGNGEGCGQKA